jgi:hypothetical protein
MTAAKILTLTDEGEKLCLKEVFFESANFRPNLSNYARAPVQLNLQLLFAASLTNPNLCLMSKVFTPIMRPCARRAFNFDFRSAIGRAPWVDHA